MHVQNKEVSYAWLLPAAAAIVIDNNGGEDINCRDNKYANEIDQTLYMSDGEALKTLHNMMHNKNCWLLVSIFPEDITLLVHMQ